MRRFQLTALCVIALMLPILPGVAQADATSDFQTLLDEAWERRVYKVEPDISEKLRLLVDQIGVVRAGPRDVVELHTQALEYMMRNVPHERAQVYIEEGRLMILELMGYLASFYRTHSVWNRETPPGDARNESV